MCDEGWDPEDAKVACTQLGYSLVANNYLGLAVPGETYFTNYQCVSDELSLDECLSETTAPNDCAGAAGVLCFNRK